MIVVVADASPLIALQQIGQLALLKALFDEVVIPPAVAREVAPRLMLPSWVRERALQQPMAREVLRASLGPGESEAISLALEIHADRLIVDERAGRRVAEALGLRVAGVLGCWCSPSSVGSSPPSDHTSICWCAWASAQTLTCWSASSEGPARMRGHEPVAGVGDGLTFEDISSLYVRAKAEEGHPTPSLRGN